jgi:hypothetical protein
MNSITNLTPQQLRHAADIQERILALQYELQQLIGSETPMTVVTAVGRRKLSAQAIANIRAGAQKRWARARKENGAGVAPEKRRRKMSPAGRASIASRMRARWAAAKKAGRNAL